MYSTCCSTVVGTCQASLLRHVSVPRSSELVDLTPLADPSGPSGATELCSFGFLLFVYVSKSSGSPPEECRTVSGVKSRGGLNNRVNNTRNDSWGRAQDVIAFPFAVHGAVSVRLIFPPRWFTHGISNIELPTCGKLQAALSELTLLSVFCYTVHALPPPKS